VKLAPTCGALLVAAAVCTPGAAQNTADYEHLVDIYAAGHLNEAVSVLGHWPRENVTAAVRALESASRAVVGAPARLPAAVMLHTDLAAAIAGRDDTDADFHLGVARSLVSLMFAKKEHASSAQEFVRRWYEFAPTLYLMTREPDKASWLVREGFTRSPANPIMHVYSGIIVELVGGVSSGVVSTPRGFNTGAGRAGNRLEVAAGEYRRALAVDAHFAPALLRLGWIHFRQRDTRARTEIEAALADATDVATKYMAHLFLGAIAERESRLAAALDEYEQAKTVGPAYQTAYVAICRIADALGDTERAQRTAATFVGIAKREDPWWDYQLGGLNMAALDWLRAAAHAP
jgi:tetratricopeptide (TPR) repeat protein